MATDKTTAGRPLSAKQQILYCLDFDGVLCDSVNEMFYSGVRACKLIWNNDEEQWIDDLERDPGRLEQVLEDFRFVRPILYVGWEAILLIKLLACSYQQEFMRTELDAYDNNNNNNYDNERTHIRTAIFERFHAKDNSSSSIGLKDHALETWGFSAEDYGAAISNARKAWIAQGEDRRGDNETSWIDAHGFYEGACRAVKNYLVAEGNRNVYVITTKAKEFALRLLEKQDLFSPLATNDEDFFRESQVFGLGSGPKASVLQSILKDRQSKDANIEFVAVMVEDNIATLDKISKSPVGSKVMPVVASWGYNSVDQLVDVFLHQHHQQQTPTTTIDKEATNTTPCVPDYVVLPLLKASSRRTVSSQKAKAKELAQLEKKTDPSGCSLASILQSPHHAGVLLSTDDDDVEYAFSSQSNIVESYFQS